MSIKGYLCSLALVGLLGSSAVLAAEKTVDVYRLNTRVADKGIAEKIGTIRFTDSEKGLVIKPDLKGLPTGNHGFHIHVNPSCEGAEKDGKFAMGAAAGDHLDPEDTGKHLGPYGHGHLGDMPYIVVDKTGNSHTQLLAPHLSVEKIENHSLIIHAHGDNYADKPKPLGGGGDRIACGVIQ